MTPERSTCALLLPLPPEQRCVLLFGEVLVDCFPDRDIPGGAPFNVAHHLRRFGMGLDPMLITRIGTDERGGHRFVIPEKQAWNFIHADVARLIALSRRPGWLYFGILARCADEPEPWSRVSQVALARAIHS